jgi:predicted permease
MLIGLGIGVRKKLKFDFKFIGVTFFAKFITWPLLILLIILLDKSFLHLYNPQIYEVMLLISIVPLAANAVAFSTLLQLHPEKASLAVLLSTVFALFYIPLVILVFHTALQ